MATEATTSLEDARNGRGDNDINNPYLVEASKSNAAISACCFHTRAFSVHYKIMLRVM